MSVEHLNYQQIYERFQENHFYIAAPLDLNPKDEFPSSYRKPHKARLKIERCSMNPLVYICSQYGTQLTRNIYYKYIVSSNLDDLNNYITQKQVDWIEKRRKFLNDELNILLEMEAKCFLDSP